jgi:hypothetical protein
MVSGNAARYDQSFGCISWLMSFLRSLVQNYVKVIL